MIKELSSTTSFKSSSDTWFYLSALFWSTDDSVLFCSSSAKQASRKYSPFLPGYSVTLEHWFGSPRIRWMQREWQACMARKRTDFWRQCRVFVVLWSLTPKLWETWNISSICMINLPEHQRCTQLSLGGTFIWMKSAPIFCFISMIHGYTAHLKEHRKLKKRLKVSEIYPESVTVLKIPFHTAWRPMKTEHDFQQTLDKAHKTQWLRKVQTPCL